MQHQSVARKPPLSSRGIFGVFLALAVFAAPASLAQTKVTTDTPAYSVPVFVSDFDLQSAPVAPASGHRSPAPASKPKTELPVVYDDADIPSAQAHRLTDFFAMALTQALTKKGFHAARAASKNPPEGALIRGVFAEPDARNRIRRALLGGDSPNTKFVLYVGIFNLARQDQPLYEMATSQVQAQGSRYGPVITLNSYVPLAKYDLSKNPTEEDVQKICSQITDSLVSLLESNPNAFSK